MLGQMARVKARTKARIKAKRLVRARVMANHSLASAIIVERQGTNVPNAGSYKAKQSLPMLKGKGHRSLHREFMLSKESMGSRRTLTRRCGS